ncbi:histone-lysine N-methyltransferase SETMAR-like isoform X2 [Tubulanus polymorphus]|uniref:histone-lysine N-methyltransferase SETMAR-like isoform X2 n=1 Tax=Tubulanus polymorphus TaxID=672921 RepID=UPI003DA25473
MFIKGIGLVFENQGIYKYCCKNVPGAGCDIELFQEQHIGCACETCVPERCPCIQRFGETYRDFRLIDANFTSRPILECSRDCNCTKSCRNRLVQHRLQRKLKVVETHRKGYGVIAEEKIGKNCFVCEYAGEVISESEARLRWKLQSCDDSNYIFVLKEHTSTAINTFIVDPKNIGNVGRFLNHSCDPNLFMLPVRIDNSIPHLALFAKRDIEIGEELCYDYSGGVSTSQENISEIKNRKACYCKSLGCKGYIPYDSLLN